MKKITLLIFSLFLLNIGCIKDEKQSTIVHNSIEGEWTNPLRMWNTNFSRSIDGRIYKDSMVFMDYPDTTNKTYISYYKINGDTIENIKKNHYGRDSLFKNKIEIYSYDSIYIENFFISINLGSTYDNCIVVRKK
jgi:hypothetical protein